MKFRWQHLGPHIMAPKIPDTKAANLQNKDLQVTTVIPLIVKLGLINSALPEEPL